MVGVIDRVSSAEKGEREWGESRESRESIEDERFIDPANDDGRVLGYDGTSGILDATSGLPMYCVVGLVVSGSGGSGARNGIGKLSDGALMHREKNGVKYPRTTTANRPRVSELRLTLKTPVEQTRRFDVYEPAFEYRIK